MSKSNTTENDLIKFMFQNVAMPAYGSNLYVALHIADPGESGDQSTSECSYGAYARVAISRDGAGWGVSGNTANNLGQIQFPTCTSGSETATHVSIGIASSGAGQILYKGALTSSLAVSLNITPQFAVSALTTSED